MGEYELLEGTARYAGLLPAPAEGFGIQPKPFWPLAKALSYGWLIHQEFTHNKKFTHN